MGYCGNNTAGCTAFAAAAPCSNWLAVRPASAGTVFCQGGVAVHVRGAGPATGVLPVGLGLQLYCHLKEHQKLFCAAGLVPAHASHLASHRVSLARDCVVTAAELCPVEVLLHSASIPAAAFVC